jgi:hypothetical protein
VITLCCPVRFWPSCRDSLAEHAPDAVIIPVAAEDSPGWWREISARWNGTEGLLLIEQDIAIHAGVVPEMETCPEPWCCFPFPRPEAPTLQDRGIACTRFSASFQQLVTVAGIEEVPGSCWECRGQDPSCWRHIDGRIGDAAAAKGITGPHVHWPPVTHRDVTWPAEKPPRW